MRVKFPVLLFFAGKLASFLGATDRPEERFLATRSVAVARHGMVAAMHPLAVLVGVQILQRDGLNGSGRAPKSLTPDKVPGDPEIAQEIVRYSQEKVGISWWKRKSWPSPIVPATYADPEFAEMPIKRLLAKNYAARQAARIDWKRAMKAVEPGNPYLAHGDTTFLATADAAGMMVALIQSNYTGFGSGYVIPTLGFGWQNRGALFTLQLATPTF